MQSCPKPCGAPLPVKRSVEGLGDGGLVVLAIAVLCELVHNVAHFAGAMTSIDGVHRLLDGITRVVRSNLEEHFPEAHCGRGDFRAGVENLGHSVPKDFGVEFVGEIAETFLRSEEHTSE